MRVSGGGTEGLARLRATDVDTAAPVGGDVDSPQSMLRLGIACCGRVNDVETSSMSRRARRSTTAWRRFPEPRSCNVESEGSTSRLYITTARKASSRMSQVRWMSLSVCAAERNQLWWEVKKAPRLVHSPHKARWNLMPAS